MENDYFLWWSLSSHYLNEHFFWDKMCVKSQQSCFCYCFFIVMLDVNVIIYVQSFKRLISQILAFTHSPWLWVFVAHVATTCFSRAVDHSLTLRGREETFGIECLSVVWWVSSILLPMGHSLQYRQNGFINGGEEIGWTLAW